MQMYLLQEKVFICESRVYENKK